MVTFLNLNNSVRYKTENVYVLRAVAVRCVVCGKDKLKYWQLFKIFLAVYRNFFSG